MRKDSPSTSSGRAWDLPGATRYIYAVALGSNRPHGRHGRPEGVLRAAVREIGWLGAVLRASRIHRTAALGPAGRSFANAALLLETELSPADLLAALKAIERQFGRRAGRRWGPRVLDLDILLWSGGRFVARGLSIPHAHLGRRRFVLAPLAEIAPDAMIAGENIRVRHAVHRLARG